VGDEAASSLPVRAAARGAATACEGSGEVKVKTGMAWSPRPSSGQSCSSTGLWLLALAVRRAGPDFRGCRVLAPLSGQGERSGDEERGAAAPAECASGILLVIRRRRGSQVLLCSPFAVGRRAPSGEGRLVVIAASCSISSSRLQ